MAVQSISSREFGLVAAEARSAQCDDRAGLWMLVALVVCLVGLPSVLIIAPLGAAGTPAGVLGDILLLIVAASRLARNGRRRLAPNPVLRALLAFVAAMCVAYLAGALRPITGEELTSADRGLLTLASWSGMVLAVGTGLRSRASLDTLLKVVAGAGGVLALVGVVQFFSGVNVAEHISVPGLTANHALAGLSVRSGFARVSGTALHAIEFGAVLSLILPITLHYAVFETLSSRRRWWWLCVGLTAFAIPLTVARSAILGLVIVLGLLFAFSWNRKQRLRALMIAPFALAILKVIVPHLIGTLTHLFTQAGDDPSIQNRLGDYQAAGYYISQSPLFGRGPFTFLADMYRTFDNEYEGMLVEAGIVGLLALLALIIIPALTALMRRRGADAQTRSLAFALFTSMMVALVTFFTFDAFAFPMCMGVFFVLVGAIGCLAQQAAAQALRWPTGTSSLRTIGETSSRSAWRSRGRWRLVGGGFAALVFLLGVNHLDSVEPHYQAIGSLKLSSPPFPGKNVYQYTLYLGELPQLLARNLTGDDTRRLLSSEGYPRYEVAVGNGSLEPGTDIVGTGSVLHISTIATSRSLAVATTEAVMKRATATLATWQERAGARADAIVSVQTSVGPDVYLVQGSKLRAAAMIGALSLAIGFGVTRALDDAASRRSRRITSQGRARPESLSLHS